MDLFQIRMNDFIVSLLLLGAVGSYDGALPYWATTNQYGLMPESNGALAWLQARTQFDESKTFQWSWGASAAVMGEIPASAGMTTSSAGMTSMGSNATWRTMMMVDELYASFRWQCLRLDLGQKRRAQEFLGADPSLGSLSVTGGHMIESGNARPMPGYLGTLEPIAVPFTGGHLKIYGSFGDYQTMDVRYVQDALVHRMLAGVKIGITDRLTLDLGLDHYALWAGHHPTQPDIKMSWSNYFRIITGRSAGVDGTLSDRINVLGDHGGSEIIRFSYRGDGWHAIAQHEIPYADRSGMKFRNFPDGVNTLNFSSDDKDRWVSDIVYEYHYTMFQSGSTNGERYDSEGHPLHPEGTWIYGGDNYFNNGFYASGWTHFGHAICDPLFRTAGTRNGTWTSAVLTKGFESTRFSAHHIGLGGKLFRKYPYKVILTYSENYGTYGRPYLGESHWQQEWGTFDEEGLKQVSAAFMGTLPELFGVKGLSAMYGIYADKGSLLEDSFGVSLGIKYTL